MYQTPPMGKYPIKFWCSLPQIGQDIDRCIYSRIENIISTSRRFLLTPVLPCLVKLIKSCQPTSESLDFSLNTCRRYTQSGTCMHSALLSNASSDNNFENATWVPFSFTIRSKVEITASWATFSLPPDRHHSPRIEPRDSPLLWHTPFIFFIRAFEVSRIFLFLL